MDKAWFVGNNMSKEEIIRKLAYFMWDDDDRPEGKALDYWLVAERHVNNMLGL